MLNRMNEWLKINQSLKKSQMYYDKNPKNDKHDFTKPNEPILHNK